MAAKLTSKLFIEKAILADELGLFDYSLVEYTGNKNKVSIKCNKCNAVFSVTPNNHLNRGSGCPICAQNQKLTTNQFIERAQKVHGTLYDYSLVKYVQSGIKVKIFCKSCDEIFEQEPGVHIHQMSGCKKCCRHPISKAEIKWLDELKIKQENRQIRMDLNSKKYVVDAFNPETNTIYEFLGDFWHGNPKKFDLNRINPLNKQKYGVLYQETMDRIQLFENYGYKVVYIWESDFKKINVKNNNSWCRS
jgi:Zn finger protein HypA/HybF involved in hydrogenase expression